MKQLLAKSIAMSLLSPLLIGVLLGGYYTFTLSQPGIQIFFSILISAFSNAHIAGLAMAVFVVPGYLLMHKYSKVQYSAVLALGMIGGAFFSYVLAATSGMGFIVNTCMAALASGLFLYGLRRFA